MYLVRKVEMKKQLFAGLVLGAALFGNAASAQASMIHHYDFNGSVTDLVGSENGVLVNGANVSGGVLNLDGVDDYVQFSSHLVPTSGSYTVSLFARQSSTQSGSFVELISQGFSSGPGFYIGKHSYEMVRVTDSWQNTDIAFPSVGELHHYAVSVDAVNKLFVESPSIVIRQKLSAGVEQR